MHDCVCVYVCMSTLGEVDGETLRGGRSSMSESSNKLSEVEES